MGIPDTRAQFTLNFTPDDGSYVNNDAYVSCNMSYIASANCSGWEFNLNGSHDDGTAFYQRMLTDSQGDLYFQVIVGDYNVDNFVVEYFIQADGANDGNWFDGGWSGDIARSASTGDPGDRLFNMTSPYDPDTSKTGSGSGNPTRVIMRQIMSDAEINSEFLKDQFDRKPLITQTINDGNVDVTTRFDMRGSTYNDLAPINSTTDFVNSTTLLGSDKFGQEGDNNVAQDAQIVDLNAGGFTYTPGTGANDFGGSNGLYNYIDDGSGPDVQPANKDYTSFCDSAQNVDWSGNGACINGDGSGSGGMGWGGWGGGGGWGW